MVIGVFILFIIILGVAITQLITLQGNDSSAMTALTVEEERRQESISLVGLTIENDSDYIANITVKNTGSITVLIKSLYIDNNFLFDPSDSSINPYGGRINPNSTLTISLKELIPRELYKSMSMLAVASARGTKSAAYEAVLAAGKNPPVTIQTSFGPLKLNFTKFYYANYSDGSIGTWMPGWRISNKEGNIVWKIEVQNIGSDTIVLNQNSCFVLMSVGGSSNPKSWYIDITSPLEILPTQIVEIVFKLNAQGTRESVPTGKAPYQCKIFLAFFGSHQPENTPYGQTIPFEAVEVYKG
jgi:archaellum component FlaG (FlaF/FlaG flagellin family)